MILCICLLICYLIWGFRIFDGLLENRFQSITIGILISAMAAAVVVSEFWSRPRSLDARGELFWFVSIIVSATALVTGDRHDRDWLAFHGAVLVMALPLWWVTWQAMRRQWLLFAGLALALVTMMLFWGVALHQTRDSLRLLLLPLPAIMLVSAIWSPGGWIIIHLARRQRNRRVAGPGMQAAAMAYLFLPAIMVAVFVPHVLELHQAWSAASLTLVGVLLGAVVAAPLRRFLLEWGDLAPGYRGLSNTPAWRVPFPTTWHFSVRFPYPWGQVAVAVAVLVAGLVAVALLFVSEGAQPTADGVLDFVPDSVSRLAIIDNRRLAKGDVPDAYTDFLNDKHFAPPGQLRSHRRQRRTDRPDGGSIRSLGGRVH